MNSLTLMTNTPEATERLGRVLAERTPTGTVIALYGDLATGKTCLVRGMSRHFAGDEPIHSPTFTLVNEYGEHPKLYHLDLYRLGGAEELIELGCEELFDSPDGLCAVEWAERAGVMLPETHLEIYLEHAGGDKRQLRIESRGILTGDWSTAFREAAEE